MGSGLIVAALVLGGGAVAVWVAWRKMQLRTAAAARLTPIEAANLSTLDARLPATPRSFAPRYYMLPWIVGLACGLALYLGARPRPVYALVPGLIIGLLGNELDRIRVGRRTVRLEGQLADAIDLMAGALQAGAGATAAFEAALRETRWPLRPHLAEVVGRIRLGDDPQAVLRDLSRRVPLENVILFVSALSVHWEVGGSLAGTLATVGKAIRDRIELARRIHSLTAQSRVSVAAVMFATYFIAVVIWRNDPSRMVGFLSTSIGSWLVGFAIVLQGIGIVWTTAASRIRY